MIRKATLDDIPQLARTEMASFVSHHFPIDEDSFYELLLDPFQIILVYEDAQNGVIGHLLAEILDDQMRMNVDSIAVLPDQRGKGIGKSLMHTAFNYARQNNIPILTLETPENDPLLRGFYQSLGLSVTGRQDDFYGDGSACLMLKMIFIWLLLIFLPFPAQAADTFILQQPIACTLGQSCWLVNYPDHDPQGGKAADFTCGSLTYDGHDGSDFAVRDLVAMETGVVVTAAAAGTVLRIRDGAPDQMPDAAEISTLMKEKKGCGNGIVLDHGEGWQTLYCHMKNGSLRVKQGQTVKTGDVLGLVGHSGIAEFPHLHFTVLKNGEIQDPFSGSTIDTPCQESPSQSPLWEEALTYQSVSIAAAGFLPSPPEVTLLRIDAAEKAELAREETTTLSLWGQFYGVVAGDIIELEIIDPDDRIIAKHTLQQEKTRARQYYWIGKSFEGHSARPGDYTGLITL
ncbi:MAG: GNAT family N-acetyltransferase, partial [Alphaproteobacteria bacterium]|nr:GNAT family N-acetyltransferase [Alphaproteobacteria bacterium]